MLIDSRYRNVNGGRATTDSEIVGLLIALLFAGQHTSSVTASWTGYRMMDNPKYMQVHLGGCCGTAAGTAAGAVAARRLRAGGGSPSLPTFCGVRHSRCERERNSTTKPPTGCPACLSTYPLTTTHPPYHPPACPQAAVDEQRRVVRDVGETLDMEVLNSMDALHLNIQEALRMNPPLIMLMRQAKEAFTVTDSRGKQYVVPKVGAGAANLLVSQRRRGVGGGWWMWGDIVSLPSQTHLSAPLLPPPPAPHPLLPPPSLQGHIVAASPSFSHRLHNVFDAPDEYQPERFAAPRDEDKALPFSYIGFGGGRHGCMVRSPAHLPACLLAPRAAGSAASHIPRSLTSPPPPPSPPGTPLSQGQNFAFLQIKTIWSLLLREFEFELVGPVPEPDYTSMVIMPKPCTVRYRRRKLTPAPAA